MKFAKFVLMGCASALVACQSPPTPQPTVVPATALPTIAATPTSRPKTEKQPVTGGPTILREGILVRRIVRAPNGSIRLTRDPISGDMFLLNPNQDIYRIILAQGDQSAANKVISKTDLATPGTATGMAFGADGALYIVINDKVGNDKTQAIVRKGVINASGGRNWSTFVTFGPYPASNTQYDHQVNGIVVSPDNKFVYINSGARTDHGEVQDAKGAHPNTREIALTTKIFRIPTNSENIVLGNDDETLRKAGYVFSDGVRNAYDLEFAPNGDLFGVDNGPDADFPDELNWLREGQHYGFPWRFGTQDNPQASPSYDPTQDKRLSTDFLAVKEKMYANDPNFPKAPTVKMIDPIANIGPDATQYRADDGSQRDTASENKPHYTFTAHRSPLGLVFADATLPYDFRPDGATLSAFITSWGSAGGSLSDVGKDLLHLRLTKKGDQYEMQTNQIAKNFKRPIDAVLIRNQLYLLEHDPGGAIWELTFE